VTDVQLERTTDTRAKPVVLVIEDDQQLQGVVRAALEGIGFDVRAAMGEMDLKRCLGDPKFDLVILDLAMDGEPYKGFELVREIRKVRSVPIVVISGHSQPWDRLRALELGIDDYVTKPFLMREVELRLRRALKLYDVERLESVGSDSGFVFSGLRLDPVRRTVQTSEGVDIVVTETEFNILKYLLYAAGRIVTRDELWRALRGQAWSPLDRALDGHVARLRAKLEPGVERPQIIKSARGIGYVIAVPVSRVHL
jgi:two-component system, OmpR family, response regulator